MSARWLLELLIYVCMAGLGVWQSIMNNVYVLSDIKVLEGSFLGPYLKQFNILVITSLFRFLLDL